MTKFRQRKTATTQEVVPTIINLGMHRSKLPLSRHNCTGENASDCYSYLDFNFEHVTRHGGSHRTLDPLSGFRMEMHLLKNNTLVKYIAAHSPT